MRQDFTSTRLGFSPPCRVPELTPAEHRQTLEYMQELTDDLAAITPSRLETLRFLLQMVKIEIADLLDHANELRN
jgi:hypothetical protein